MIAFGRETLKYKSSPIEAGQGIMIFKYILSATLAAALVDVTDFKNICSPKPEIPNPYKSTFDIVDCSNETGLNPDYMWKNMDIYATNVPEAISRCIITCNFYFSGENVCNGLSLAYSVSQEDYYYCGLYNNSNVIKWPYVTDPTWLAVARK